MSQKTYFISLGGAGNAILDEVISKTNLVTDENNAAFINFSSSDISSDKKKNLLIIDGDGTGRSKQKGQELIRKNSKEINTFIETFYKKGPIKETKPFNICIISSMGGGTGSSLSPYIIEALNQYDNNLMSVMMIAVISSPKEGVATLPNSIKSFQEIYNDLILTGKLKTCFMIDNKKFETDFNIHTYDFEKMNSVIANVIEMILNEDQFRRSAGGHQSLDVNEFRRVLSWGQGLCDISLIDFDQITEDVPVNVESLIFSGKYKYNTAKAIAVSVMFADEDSKVTPEQISAVSSLIEKIKKKFSSGFFVFGYSFDNKKQSGQSVPVRFKIFSNGIDLPKMIESNIKKATKEVKKLKVSNNKLEIGSGEDLDLQ